MTTATARVLRASRVSGAACNACGHAALCHHDPERFRNDLTQPETSPAACATELLNLRKVSGLLVDLQPASRPAPMRHDSPTMNRDAVLALLREHLPVLTERFGVRGLRLFGSVARGTARADSDIDILVAYSQPPDSDQYFGTQFYLEDLLGRPVDLVTETALRERLRPYVERDAIAI